MCIDVEDLIEKIIVDSSKSVNLFRQLTDTIATMTLPYPYTSTVGHPNNIKNDKFINDKLCALYDNNKITGDPKEYQIFDVIRHSFLHYCSGGVYDLFKYRETEEWYPKIVIRKNIGKRDDINALDDEIIIYRGTSCDEFESGKFSQSWTLDKDIAYEFAFIRYADRPKYANTVRALVEAKVKKEHIYHYIKSDREKEAIIDEREIITGSSKLLSDSNNLHNN